MKVKKVTQYFSSDFSVNTYVVIDKQDCILIDPGLMSQELKEFIKNYNLKFILLTHGHYDHFGGIKDLNVPIYINEFDKILLEDTNYNYAHMFNDVVDLSDKEIILIKDEDEIKFNDITIKSINTPGHSKGSSCYFIDNCVFTGDTLFVESIGRTDLYSGNSKMIMKSLEILKTLVKSNDIIYPGHGGRAKFSIVKKMNYYLK
ncbi:MBL fold metallo-hydrolase [Mycoplasmatota bacterium]|nr:MBL fold metallo-hydrolase [Mycoplasmatota bacterium]